MSGGLKLVVHFGERDRVDGELLSDVLMDLLASRGVLASALLRGVEGFGLKHQLRTDRLLTLSEDLPLVVIAVDREPEVIRLAAEVVPLVEGGLVTLERVAIADRDGAPALASEDAKLTLYCGRGAPGARHRPVAAALELLRDAGMPGATALLGLDGTILGTRRRARFFSRNDRVPAMVVSVGRAEILRAVLPGLRSLPGDHVTTIERVHVVRRAGRVLGELPARPAHDENGLGIWQRITVFCGERARWGDAPLAAALVRELRAARAAGATALRGTLGYSDDTRVHGDRVLALRRDAPMVVTLIDRADEVVRLWPIVARATAHTGLVTCETVPAYHALGPEGARYGGLQLARIP